MLKTCSEQASRRPRRRPGDPHEALDHGAAEGAQHRRQAHLLQQLLGAVGAHPAWVMRGRGMATRGVSDTMEHNRDAHVD